MPMKKEDADLGVYLTRDSDETVWSVFQRSHPFVLSSDRGFAKPLELTGDELEAGFSLVPEMVAYAPDGKSEIVGPVVELTAVELATSFRVHGGRIVNYACDETSVDWESARYARRDGERLWRDSNGATWKESELTYKEIEK